MRHIMDSKFIKSAIAFFLVLFLLNQLTTVNLTVDSQLISDEFKRNLANVDSKIHQVVPDLIKHTENNQNSQELIVYTAHQDWPIKSRIYIMNTDGSVITYFEYDNILFCDCEVIHNEVYIVDWVAPRLYRVNLSNGILDIIIDDWSLLYMYDIAFDGTYFYTNEWSLNRYSIDGSFDSAINFSLDVRGSAWNGRYYWTLDDSNTIRCWNISAWPSIVEVQNNAFSPPTTQCKGLWFDGEYFWTAEFINGIIGEIYRFDFNGTIVDQWDEPIFTGYSACLISNNTNVDSNSHITFLESNWNLFSLPFNNTLHKEDLLITFQNFSYTWNNATSSGIINDFVFGWNRSNQNYIFADILTPSNGYWLYSYKDSCELWTESNNTNRDEFITDLQIGWNLVSTPFNESINKNSILVNNMNWSTAVANGLINDFIFKWDRAGQFYDFTTIFLPGHGYWLYASQSCELTRI